MIPCVHFILCVCVGGGAWYIHTSIMTSLNKTIFSYSVDAGAPGRFGQQHHVRVVPVDPSVQLSKGMRLKRSTATEIEKSCGTGSYRILLLPVRRSFAHSPFGVLGWVRGWGRGRGGWRRCHCDRRPRRRPEKSRGKKLSLKRVAVSMITDYS